jgi:hypothetical protein
VRRRRLPGEVTRTTHPGGDVAPRSHDEVNLSEKTTHDRRAWKPYFERLAARMRLAHWDLEISDEPPRNEDAYATVRCCYGRTLATIWLGDGFLRASPEEQRYVCVHELVHCYFAHADELAGGEMAGRVEEAWNLAMEYGVDAVAKALAPFMPMPPGATPPPTRREEDRDVPAAH